MAISKPKIGSSRSVVDDRPIVSMGETLKCLWLASGDGRAVGLMLEDEDETKPYLVIPFTPMQAIEVADGLVRMAVELDESLLGVMLASLFDTGPTHKEESTPKHC